MCDQLSVARLPYVWGWTLPNVWAPPTFGELALFYAAMGDVDARRRVEAPAQYLRCGWGDRVTLRQKKGETEFRITPPRAVRNATAKLTEAGIRLLQAEASGLADRVTWDDVNG